MGMTLDTIFFRKRSLALGHFNNWTLLADMDVDQNRGLGPVWFELEVFYCTQNAFVANVA